MNKIDILLATGKFSLFHPTSKGDLLLEYKELRQMESFMALENPKKMLFVWFYACKCSRARELHDEADRIQYAIHAAWKGRAPKEVTQEYPNRKWGTKVQAAIDDMRAYEPEPRILLKLMAMQTVEDVKKLFEDDVNTLQDWDQKQKFIKARREGLELVRQLIPLLEERALGVVEKTVEQEEEEGAVMSMLHNELAP